MTHGVQWLPNVDKIVVLVNGEISEMGSYEELLSHDGPFAQFLKTYLTQEDSDSGQESDEDGTVVSSCVSPIQKAIVSFCYILFWNYLAFHLCI